MGISRTVVAITLILGVDGMSSAGETGDHLPPVRERFGAPGVVETPDFQRHVIPLLGRLGCNGRKCHGAFQGQNGFRLSLFGYDFTQDHQALAARVTREAPAASLVLRKPTLGAGQRRSAIGGLEFVKPLGLKDFEPVVHLGEYATSSGEQGGSKWLDRRGAIRIARN